MDPHLTQPDAGYSPPIYIELILHGERFNVASLGPERLSLRDPRAVQGGKGTVRVVVDGHVMAFQVELADGIQSERTDYTYRELVLTDATAA